MSGPLYLISSEHFQISSILEKRHLTKLLYLFVLVKIGHILMYIIFSFGAILSVALCQR